jgi:hypothetical protein
MQEFPVGVQKTTFKGALTGKRSHDTLGYPFEVKVTPCLIIRIFENNISE